jgi:hypothetical protein
VRRRRRWQKRGESGRLGVKTWRCGTLTGVEVVRRRRRGALGHAWSGAERWWLQTRLSVAREARRRGSDRGAVGRRLYGAGAWQPRGNGVLTGGPGAKRERLTGGTPRQ